MNALSELALAFAGRPALILGGGESLPAQAALAPANAVKFSANQHGALLMPCDFIVSCDDLAHKELERPRSMGGGVFRILDLKVPIISTRRSISTYFIPKHPINNSGCTAAWVAWALGCAPILLAGMDCFLGATYWHNAKADSTGKYVPFSHHYGNWLRLQELTPRAMYRSLGGPLADAFPAYNPEEEPVVATMEEVLPHISGKRVRILHHWPWGPKPWEPGQIVELNQGEFEVGTRKQKVQAL